MSIEKCFHPPTNDAIDWFASNFFFLLLILWYSPTRPFCQRSVFYVDFQTLQRKQSFRMVTFWFNRILSLFLVFIQLDVDSCACIKCCSLFFPSIVCHTNSLRGRHRKLKKNAIYFAFFLTLFSKIRFRRAQQSNEIELLSPKIID